MRKLQKVTIPVLVGIFLLILAACGGDDSSTTSSDSGSGSTTTTAATAGLGTAPQGSCLSSSTFA